MDDNKARRGDWIQTFTGKKFFPLDPRPEDVCVEDIAHALSMLCRFDGHCSRFYSVAEHCSRFYSVAEHCLHVARAIEGINPAHAWRGLMHDASEAYLIDVPRPVKMQPEMEAYRSAERQLQSMIDTKFFGVSETPRLVHEIDNDMLHAEAEQLMRRKPEKWNLRPRMHSFDPGELGRLTPVEAETVFLQRFRAYEALSRVAA